MNGQLHAADVSDKPLIKAMAEAIAELAAEVDMTRHPDVIFVMEWHRHHKGARYG